MALELKWTKRAAQGYDRIIKHLEKEWGEKEVENFVRKTHAFFELLKLYPHLLPESPQGKHLHRGPIDKLTILTYRVKPRKKIIELVNIRSARRKQLKG